MRAGLAAVWLVSGGLKVVDPAQTEVAVRAYRLLPEALVEPVALVLPFAELGLGLLLVVGVGVRLVGAASAVVLVLFMVGVSSAWARGLSIDCGCFGGGGVVADAPAATYVTELVRDTAFLAMALWLLVRPRSPFAVGPRSSPSRSPGGVSS